MTDSFDRIAFANPAPQGTDLPSALMSTTALLDIIDEGAAIMPVETTPIQTRETDKPTSTRRGWLTAAVAFGVVLVVGTIFIVLSRQSQEISPAQENTTTTVAPDAMSPEMAANVARANEIIAIWNEGDLSAFNNTFQESAPFGKVTESTSDVQRYLALRMVLNDQRTGDCAPSGSGQAIRCELMSVDDLGGPLGISTPVNWRLTLSDSGKITALSTTERVGMVFPMNEMAKWLKAVHPGVWESLDWNGPGIGDPEGLAATLLEYYDEFVAQSDEFSYTD
ncbi:hypothetical protein MNBD_ACTINO01-1407 [hydrothermal vent metagenome]|uniref:Uncharacterized protein n=1 Tax=hydrothermal vent metagenome TaxID=652676 RepID=A0A3B0SEC9_9ZZZZ